MDYFLMTAPCGQDCFNCPFYLASENKRYKRILSKKMRIPFDKASCKGCRCDNGMPAFLDRNEPCNIMRCTQEKGVRFCFECLDFPCDYLHPLADRASLWPHNTKVFNLCLIKKMGLEAWARTKAKRVFETYYKEKIENLFK